MKKRWVEHIIEEDSRFHIIWWDSLGRHCSEPDCEINKTNKDRPKRRAATEEKR